MADVKKNTKATKATKSAVEVKTVAQLQEELVQLRNDHREARRSHQLGELVNPRVLREKRKTVARALTAIKQAEIAEAAQPSAPKEEN